MIDPAARRARREARRGEVVPTVRMTHLLGIDHLSSPDPTEDYHEASRVHPGIVDPHVGGAAQLERSVEMRISVARSVKRHPGRPFQPLPEPRLANAALGESLALRRSHRAFDDRALRLGELATVLHAAYGVTGALAGTEQALRTVPSGGALYPLELYVACSRVDEAERALYHYDPLRHGLERLRPISPDALAELSPYGEVLASSAAVLLVTGVFWRSRFKYGDRAYRFTLLEAGHVGQNVVLAATALGLASVPIGGFFDRRADAFLGIDGLHEASLYLFPLGGVGR